MISRKKAGVKISTTSFGASIIATKTGAKKENIFSVHIKRIEYIANDN